MFNKYAIGEYGRILCCSVCSFEWLYVLNSSDKLENNTTPNAFQILSQSAKKSSCFTIFTLLIFFLFFLYINKRYFFDQYNRPNSICNTGSNSDKVAPRSIHRITSGQNSLNNGQYKSRKIIKIVRCAKLNGGDTDLNGKEHSLDLSIKVYSVKERYTLDIVPISGIKRLDK